MKTLMRIIAVLILAAGGIAVASPAQAIGTCNPASICLYQATNYGQERWMTSLYNVSIHWDRCLNIAPARWSNNTPVNDNAGSMIINNFSGPDDVVVYNWVDGQEGGGARVSPPSEGDLFSNLNNFYYNYMPSGPTLYHTITSICLRTH